MSGSESEKIKAVGNMNVSVCQFLARLFCRHCFFCIIAAALILTIDARMRLASAGSINLTETLQQLFTANKDKSGIYVLEKGEESLLARAWLTDNARESIDVQYFIWSADNIGILAAEALLRAADRGVKVRVIVDDLLIDAPAESMVALAAHENIDIRIYNPRHSVGVSLWRRVSNLLFHFRSSNQRMHDKTFMVDGTIAITGGRNMADEYFDYNHTYNFRDRDVLVLGPVVSEMGSSFDAFWSSDLTKDVESLLETAQKQNRDEQEKIYKYLFQYARNPENFEPAAADKLQKMPEVFPYLIRSLVWDDIEFISDLPGKNKSKGLGGGGRATRILVDRLLSAKKSVIIQSPYLVLPEEGFSYFKKLHGRGVEIRISTNSLSSSDNLQAFSGYSKQRGDILASGAKIYEYKPAPEIQQQLLERYKKIEKAAPTFAIHAKTMIIDSEHVYIGTFNLDPRSVNLNTEVGILIGNKEVARQVEQSVLRDMSPENSWEAVKDKPDRFAPWYKRVKVFFWKLLPLTPLL